MKTPTILVVEDEPDVRNLVVMTLKQAEYHVITASDGVEALKRCEEHTPQLILLDISMPRVNGLDLLYLLKDMELLSRTQVVMLTALGYQEVVQKAMGYGVKDFIVKPFDVLDLLQRVERLMVSETNDPL
ncbi:MAG: response regulator [Anaerolineales bacterium]|nr:response regulator [Anaerolineales bacterium]